MQTEPLMNIQLDNEYKKLCYIRSIKPGYINVSAILILIILTLLTLGIPLLLYWKWQRFRNIVHLIVFTEASQDAPGITHYLIIDSFKKQGKQSIHYFRSRNMLYRNCIVSPYFFQTKRYHMDQEEVSLCKYIQHKNLRYIIRNNTLESIKFRISRELQEYLEKGLSQKEIDQSLKIFGEAGSSSINFFYVFRKILHQKRLKFVIMMFAVKKIIFGFISKSSNQSNQTQTNQIIVLMLILAEILATFIILLGISIFCAKEHNKFHGQLDEKQYKVIRSGQRIEVKSVKLKDLCVGDVVVLTNSEKEVIYFRGIFTTDKNVHGYVPYGVVNEKLYNQKERPVLKIPIETSRATIHEENIINPGTLVGSLVACTDFEISETWIHIFLSTLVMCFPFNLAFFCSISQILSIYRLKKENISVSNPMIEEIGIANYFSLELSCFETLQYRGFIKRSQCNGLPDPLLYENKELFFDTYRRTKDESFFAFLGWLGIFNRAHFKKHEIYQKLFEQFGFQLKQNDYDDEQNPRITNSFRHIINIDWEEIQRFKVSGMLLESAIIKNHTPDKPNKKFLAITQGEIVSEECYDFFDKIVHERGSDQWKDVMQRIYSQGKKIQYLCCKKLSAQNGVTYPTFNRLYSETKSEFMGLLVFDEWPNQQKMKDLMVLDFLQSKSQQDDLMIKIFSFKQQNGLIGYDHTLRNTHIYHSMSSSLRTQENLISKTQYQGVIHVGNGILDQGSLLVSDVSVNIVSQSYGQADFLIPGTNQFFTLLNEGHWALQNASLTAVCLVLFNFCKIVGQIVLFQAKNSGNLVQLSKLYEKLFLMDFGLLIVPILLLNLYEPVKQFEKNLKPEFLKFGIMGSVFIALAGLTILYTIEFIEKGFSGTCQFHDKNLKERLLIALRGQEHKFGLFQNSANCQGVVNFVSVSFCLLTIFLLDRESPQRKARNLAISLINKIYMVLLWIGTIIIFHIPLASVINSAAVILTVVAMVLLSQHYTTKKSPFPVQIQEQEVQNTHQEKQMNQERQRVRQRLRSFRAN